MSDFHHWDAAETLSAQEAAALVLGIDPLDPQAALWKAGTVLERMKEGHRIAKAFATQVMTPAEFGMQRKLRTWADALVSVLFDSYPVLQKNPWPSDPNRPYELPARFAGPDGEFQVQKFARAEIKRWLSVVGIKSIYPFDSQPPNATQNSEALALPLAADASDGEEPDKARPVPLKAETVPDAPPLMPVGASGSVEHDKDGPVANWKMQIQTEATALCLRLRKSGANPTTNSIVDSMSKWCINNGIMTDGGIHPSANYLRTHVLGGKYWNVPR